MKLPELLTVNQTRNLTQFAKAKLRHKDFYKFQDFTSWGVDSLSDILVFFAEIFQDYKNDPDLYFTVVDYKMNLRELNLIFLLKY